MMQVRGNADGVSGKGNDVICTRRGSQKRATFSAPERWWTVRLYLKHWSSRRYLPPPPTVGYKSTMKSTQRNSHNKG